MIILSSVGSCWMVLIGQISGLRTIKVGCVVRDSGGRSNYYGSVFGKVQNARSIPALVQEVGAFASITLLALLPVASTLILSLEYTPRPSQWSRPHLRHLALALSPAFKTRHQFRQCLEAIANLFAHWASSTLPLLRGVPMRHLRVQPLRETVRVN